MTIPVVPRPAATVMLLRDEAHADVEQLEVLLLRRSGDADHPALEDLTTLRPAIERGDEQRAVPDDWEAVEATWWHPAEALAAWQADDIHLIEPTVASLELLTEFDTSTAALAVLRGDDR